MCGEKQPPSYTTTGNNLHNHANNARTSWRSDVPIILPGWGVTRVGPGLNPQYTRAWYAGGLWVAHSTALNRCSKLSSTLQHGGATTVATVSQSLRSVHKTRQDETVCVSVIPYQNLWSESVQRGSDPITDRVMDRSVVQRVVFPSCSADDPEDREIPHEQFFPKRASTCSSGCDAG